MSEALPERPPDLLHDSELCYIGTVDAARTYEPRGRWCFCAHPTRLEEGVWHGFPVVGCDVDERVLARLEETGEIDRQQRRRLRRQKQLPPEWP